MYEKFTDRARLVMAIANQEAQRFNHEYVGTEHLLLGLVKGENGVGAAVIRGLGIDLRKIRLEVEKSVKSGQDMVSAGKLPKTPRAKAVIDYAIDEAANLNHNYVGTEHILLGLLREHDGVAAQVLMNLGLKLEEVREEIKVLLSDSDAGPDEKYDPIPKCPECGEIEARILGTANTCMSFYPFIDSKGKKHNHDGNRKTELRKCKNGHCYNVPILNTCWCGWIQDSDCMVAVLDTKKEMI